jgi:hypothetical protein
MKRMSRRQFGKLAALGAVGVPFASGIRTDSRPDIAGDENSLKLQGKAGPNPPLTPQQSEKLAEAVAKRDQQLAGVRSHTLPYGLEPAFVFRVRTPDSRSRKPHPSEGN